MWRELGARVQRLVWAVLLTVSAALGLVLLIATVASAVLVVVWVGLPLLVVCIALLRQLANLYRFFAYKLLGTRVPSAYLRVAERGFLRRPIALGRDRSTWRDLAWLSVNSTAGLILPIVAIVESLLGLLFWWLPRSILLTVDAHIARGMLSPSEQAQLAHRVQQLTESRAETVDTQAAELRRIERDLHDGAQARLVSVGMSLGLAEEQLEADPAFARQLLAEARTANSQALSELRDLVRGIHPPVLADRGLVGAVQALALAGSIPVTVATNVDGRLPAPVESAAYFAIAEALANAIKHSGASRIDIDLTREGELLRMQVRDDGRGGASIDAGSGLLGVQGRLGAFDGRLVVDSPSGGPTVVAMELPLPGLIYVSGMANDRPTQSPEELPSGVSGQVGVFDRFAGIASMLASRAPFFAGCVALIVIWAPSYFLFDLDTWQLIINTATTIITFLLVALLQNSQTRSDHAIQHKLNAIANGLADLMDAQATRHQDDDLRQDLTELRLAVGLEDRETTSKPSKRTR